MTCGCDPQVERTLAEDHEVIFSWRKIVANVETAAASSRGFWSSCVVDLDATAGGANIVGSTVKIFAVSRAGEVLIASGLVVLGGPQRVVSAFGKGAERWKVTVSGNPAAPIPDVEIPVSVLCFGRDP